MERTRYIPCPNDTEGCKYTDTPEGCHLSEHHIFPSKITSCRNIHDLLDTFPPPNYPQPDEMRRVIERES